MGSHEGLSERSDEGRISPSAQMGAWSEAKAGNPGDGLPRDAVAGTRDAPEAAVRTARLSEWRSPS